MCVEKAFCRGASELSSMREPSGRAWAVWEASPSKKEQPLTFVLRAPSRFFSINSLRDGYASKVRAVFRRARRSFQRLVGDFVSENLFFRPFESDGGGGVQQR